MRARKQLDKMLGELIYPGAKDVKYAYANANAYAYANANANANAYAYAYAYANANANAYAYAYANAYANANAYARKLPQSEKYWVSMMARIKFTVQYDLVKAAA